MHSVGGAPDPEGDGAGDRQRVLQLHPQLEYPGDMLAKHYVANPGRTSFDTYITLERTDEPGVICAAGGATTVWVNFQQQKSVPLPEVMGRCSTEAVAARRGSAAARRGSQR